MTVENDNRRRQLYVPMKDSRSLRHEYAKHIVRALDSHFAFAVKACVVCEMPLVYGDFEMLCLCSFSDLKNVQK